MSGSAIAEAMFALLEGTKINRGANKVRHKKLGLAVLLEKRVLYTLTQIS